MTIKDKNSNSKEALEKDFNGLYIVYKLLYCETNFYVAKILFEKLLRCLVNF